MNNAAEMLLDAARNSANKKACEDIEKSMSYMDLLNSAYETTLKINEIVKERKKLILVISSRTIESLIAIWGIVLSGNYYVCVDGTIPNTRLKEIIDYVEPQLVIIADKKYCQSSDLRVNHVTAEQTNKCYNYNTIVEHVKSLNILETDPLYMVFTSGTTGMPKGVIKSNRSVLSFVDSFTSEFDIKHNEPQVFGNQASFDFDVSAKDIYVSVYTHSVVFLIPNSVFLMPTKLTKTLTEHNVSILIWSAAAIKYVHRFNCFRDVVPRSIKKVFFSGESMTGECISYWRSFLPNSTYVNLYAPSEVTGNCLFHIVADSKYEGILPLNRVFSNIQILVLNENQGEIKDGEVGEIYVGGPFLAKGYYKMPDLTEKKFIQNPLHNDYTDIVFKTGDYVRKEGESLFFLGRVDNQVKHMGHRIELEEIEADCSKSGIKAEVCAIYDDDKDKIILYVDDEALSYQLIVDKLKAITPKYMIPQEVIYIKEIPHNERGKINRNKVNEIYKGIGCND